VSDLKGKHLHLDCPSGIAGDMTLGALFDLGVPVEVVKSALAKLPVGGYRLSVEKTLRKGLAGTDVKVLVEDHHHHHDDHHDHHHDHDHDHDHHHHDEEQHHHEHGDHTHRHWADIKPMLDALPADVKQLSVKIFELIAVAEAKLHGVTVSEVAFHEVGAIDSIVDIVGTAAAIAWLAPASISCSPVPLGHGTVKAAHGILPIPAPATLEITRAAGVPTIDGGIDKELCTPTGAAIVGAIVSAWGPMPPARALAVGYGAGDRDLVDRANLLRAVVASPLTSADQMVQLEANLDDMNPELTEYVAERLFAAGAVDVWWAPVTMKKSRPALVLSVLAPAARLDELTRIVLTETTTLGVRHAAVDRRVLDRRVETVDTPYGRVPVKVGALDGKIVNVAPEYEACRAIARERGVPLKEIYAAATAAFRSSH
jgi:uncharacterized protein (TIGR00299 family) protein